GGGGFGDPLQRGPEAVLASVFDGLLTIECAHDVYGVVIDRAAMAIDAAATRALRKKIAAGRAALAVSSPNRPGAGGWVLRDMRQGDEYFIDAQ
ncbi:MAG: hypothetical protein QGI52_07000, partial [Alphaproteobacteria bacterium]|nr:hypothetical protein [Alphaproteobacteria bacterium]